MLRNKDIFNEQQIEEWEQDKIFAEEYDYIKQQEYQKYGKHLRTFRNILDRGRKLFKFTNRNKLPF